MSGENLSTGCDDTSVVKEKESTVEKPDESDAAEKLLRLPMSRIKKIMKMDPVVNLASQEAVFLISKATELMLDSLTRETYWFTAQEKKKTVLKKHLESAVNSIDVLAFLEGTLD